MQTFFTYIDFFVGYCPVSVVVVAVAIFFFFFIQKFSCVPCLGLGLGRAGPGWDRAWFWAYIFRTCFSTFVMTGSNWVLSKLYIILHNIFFLAQIVCSVPVNDVARRANSKRHEFHVTQRLVHSSARDEPKTDTSLTNILERVTHTT